LIQVKKDHRLGDGLIVFYKKKLFVAMAEWKTKYTEDSVEIAIPTSAQN
jgi:hypothetical protein